MPDFSSSSLPDLTKSFIDENYLHLVELTASGEFAKVYKALDTTSPTDDPFYYAVKCLGFAERDSSQGRILEAELTNHYRLRYDTGVVRLHPMFREGDFIFLVLDWCPGGDLFDAIFNDFLFEGRPRLVRDTFVDILDAVAQCHARGIYHGDIRPANILLSGRGKGVKLADFGTSTSEEVVGGGDNGESSYRPRDSDLWSCALTLFTLVTSTRPWGLPHIIDPDYAAFSANPDTYFQDAFGLTPAANDFFRWCFAEDPTTRPTLAQMRFVILRIERFTLKSMPPRSVAAHQAPPVEDAPTFINSSLSCTSSSSSSASSSATTTTPPASPPSSTSLMDDPNVGWEAISLPPLVPTKLNSPVLPPQSPGPVIVLVPVVRLYHLRRKDVVLREKILRGQRRARTYYF
ncbi:kinase-like domain-containing protein [Roridomyces roridus]|uniref:Kinase-like domain-containing protein n=1 Tax=Roridomyces roridus TaxID=1738132 RepID=A0AAD7B372_9AGAR|nr:kinase-like domain-containing protein [Roridomyces roridus]